ncbi:hypothetical protein [Chlamydiifrater phoenicopteri]|uniref:hypothetical protein n=1 Tax=Chlamydiifrater phoenicopteri TaxID=2681469 RepID=UPI001BCB7679|nr:hypothetical protein [Chlamydiifrater phoenicopteri]
MITKIFLGIPFKESFSPFIPKDWCHTTYQGRRFVGKHLSSPYPTAKEIHNSAHELLEFLSKNLPVDFEPNLPITIFPEVLIGF